MPYVCRDCQCESSRHLESTWGSQESLVNPLMPAAPSLVLSQNLPISGHTSLSSYLLTSSGFRAFPYFRDPIVSPCFHHPCVCPWDRCCWAAGSCRQRDDALKQPTHALGCNSFKAASQTRQTLERSAWAARNDGQTAGSASREQVWQLLLPMLGTNPRRQHRRALVSPQQHRREVTSCFFFSKSAFFFPFSPPPKPPAPHSSVAAAPT